MSGSETESSSDSESYELRRQPSSNSIDMTVSMMLDEKVREDAAGLWHSYDRVEIVSKSTSQEDSYSTSSEDVAPAKDVGDPRKKGPRRPEEPPVKRQKVTDNIYEAERRDMAYLKALDEVHGCRTSLDGKNRDEFVTLFLAKNETRKFMFDQKTFKNRVSMLFRKETAAVPFGWIYMQINQCYDIEPAELAKACAEMWDRQAQNLGKYELFPDKHMFDALISVLWLVKSSMFSADFSPELESVKNPNPQYPRTIFMVPRFRKHFLTIVQRKKNAPEDDRFKVLFRISWDNFEAGTFRIEKTHYDIPEILRGFELYSGKKGQTIYNDLLKGKVVEQYNV